MRKPNFFILGAPKCGTTSFWSWLRAHQDIFMSSVKEPNFFNSDDNLGISNLTDYEELFRGARDSHAAVGEASVWYLSSPVAVQNILQYQPEARFVVLLRDPIEMAVAVHSEMLVGGLENVTDFRTAWGLQGERRQGRRLPLFSWPQRCFLYGDDCLLGAQLQRLLAVTKRNRVLPILLDDIRENPRREYIKVLEFLGVSDDGRANFPAVNTARTLRWPLLARSQFIIGQLKRRLHINFSLNILKAVYTANVIAAERSELDRDACEVLKEYFTRDVDLLGGLIGRDLRSWMEISTVRVGAEVRQPGSLDRSLTLARPRRSEVPFRGGDSLMSGRLEWDDHG
jgi:Sulfotransferase domain